MRRALELARHGEGYVEPNPMVGAVLVREGEIVGEGWHQRYGGPHAEIIALSHAGARARGATLYVTLEPCCHWGKTPPCTDAIVQAGIRRVVAAMLDPFPAVSGRGMEILRQCGVAVEIGLLENEARELNAPYLKRVLRGRPWVIAKWAMSLDGKIATRRGESKWLSGESSRALARQWRGRVDAVVIGIGTALRDDPSLTAPPESPRTPTRIVLDMHLRLPMGSQLVQTARTTPLLVAHGPGFSDSHRQQLLQAGAECLELPLESGRVSVTALLDELGRRQMTNVLVEGGGQVLGSFFDGGQVDEVRVFVAPVLIGGTQAPTPIAGQGINSLTHGRRLRTLLTQTVGTDVLIVGRLDPNDTESLHGPFPASS